MSAAQTEQNEVYDCKLTAMPMIVLSAFVFSPVASALFIFRNCRNLGKARAGRKIVVYACIYTAVLIILTTLIDELVFYLLLPLINCLIAWLAVESTHGKELETHIKNGGPEYSVWSNIATALGGVAVTLLIYSVLYGLHHLLDNIR